MTIFDLYSEGERACSEGRFVDAIALFTKALGLDEQFRQRDVTLYAQRAFAKQRMGDYQGAIPDYTRAIGMEPQVNQAQYHFHRGMCFSALGDPQQAVAECTRAIELYPDHPGPYHLRGKLYASVLGRPAEAIADFDRLLAQTALPEGFQLRGYAKLCLGQGQAAIPDLLESHRLAADTYTAYLLAWAGAIAPDDELCYRSMEAVLRVDPSYRQFFVENADYARFRDQPRFRQIVG